MDIILIRHTPTAALPGTCYGQLDVALAKTCALDIAATLASIEPVDVVFSSPAQRCTLLAEPLAKRDAASLVIEPELRELNFGAWEGKSWSDVPRNQSDPWAEDPWSLPPPGGETESALWSRVDTWRQRVLPTLTGRVAIVAHAGSLRALRCLLLQRSPSDRWAWQLGYGATEILRFAS